MLFVSVFPYLFRPDAENTLPSPPTVSEKIFPVPVNDFGTAAASDTGGDCSCETTPMRTTP